MAQFAADAEAPYTIEDEETLAHGRQCIAFNVGAIKREMNSAKWFWFAIGYQTLFAYLTAFAVNQIGGMLTGRG